MVNKKHRYITTDIWQARWFKKLSIEAKYLYFYLLTNPQTNLCGVYEIMDEQIQFDTNIADLHKVFTELQQASEVVRIDDWCIVLRYPTNQKWQTAWAIADRIASELDELPKNILDAVRNYDYQYPPIKTDKAFTVEKERIKQAKGRRKGTAITEPAESPKQEEPTSQTSCNQYQKQEAFNEYVPFG